MAEWSLKFADARGEIRQEVAEAASEGGNPGSPHPGRVFLVYSIKPRSEKSRESEGLRVGRKKINVEKIPDLQSAVS